MAALVALLEFGFSDLYLPGHAALNLNVTARFGNIEYDPQRRQLAVPVTVRMRNTSTVRVSLLASSYTVTGMKVGTSTKAAPVDVLMRRAAQEMGPVSGFHQRLATRWCKPALSSYSPYP